MIGCPMRCRNPCVVFSKSSRASCSRSVALVSAIRTRSIASLPRASPAGTTGSTPSRFTRCQPRAGSRVAAPCSARTLASADAPAHGTTHTSRHSLLVHAAPGGSDHACASRLVPAANRISIAALVHAAARGRAARISESRSGQATVSSRASIASACPDSSAKTRSVTSARWRKRPDSISRGPVKRAYRPPATARYARPSTVAHSSSDAGGSDRHARSSLRAAAA